jgi:hypothetical protein
MFAAHDRNATREVFFRAWQRHRAGEPLEGVETAIVRVAQAHPEYHALLDDPDCTERDFLPELGETNPFLHLAMHIAIDEQLALDEPRGIRERYRRWRAAGPDEHELQHRMMDCLGEMLWLAQREQRAPDPSAYLGCLQRLLGK